MKARNDFGILIDVIDYLTEKPRSMPKLTSEFPVDARTIYRYLEQLETLGFEVIRTRPEHFNGVTFHITRVSPEFKQKINKIHEKISLH